MRFLILIGFFLALFGCGVKGNADVITLNLDEESIYDLNGDGIKDITVQYENDQSYYELIDRNFDGAKDESHHYDRTSHIIKSKMDDDFDGVLETNMYYINGTVSTVVVDINKDSFIDIIFIYKNGTLLYAEKYYDVGRSKIGRIDFAFGYPVSGEIIKESGISRLEWLKRHGLNGDRAWVPHK